jgi:hypothetical protein
MQEGVKLEGSEDTERYSQVRKGTNEGKNRPFTIGKPSHRD